VFGSSASSSRRNTGAAVSAQRRSVCLLVIQGIVTYGDWSVAVLIGLPLGIALGIGTEAVRGRARKARRVGD
jgi:hypothetical protein